LTASMFLEKMLAEADVQIVDLATPTFLHADMTRMAAEAGKHVHCEKPFCRSVGEGLSACRSVADRGVKLVVGETYVFLASHKKARELIEAGEIGRPLQVRQRHASWVRRQRLRAKRQNASEGWRMDGVQSGGGDYPWIFDHAVHFFAAAEFFMLDRKINEVYSVTGTCQRRRRTKGGSPEASYAVPGVDVPIITWTFEDSDCQGVCQRPPRVNGRRIGPKMHTHPG